MGFLALTTSHVCMFSFSMKWVHNDIRSKWEKGAGSCSQRMLSAVGQVEVHKALLPMGEDLAWAALTWITQWWCSLLEGQQWGDRPRVGWGWSRWAACPLLTAPVLSCASSILSLLGNLGLWAPAGEGGGEWATGQQTNGSLRLGLGGAYAAMERREAWDEVEKMSRN